MAKKRSTSTTLYLDAPVALTIESVEEFVQTALSKLTPKTRKATLDATQLEVLTTPGIQSLISLHTSLSEQGATLIIEGLGESPREAFALAGLGSYLDDILLSTASGDTRE